MFWCFMTGILAMVFMVIGFVVGAYFVSTMDDKQNYKPVHTYTHYNGYNKKPKYYVRKSNKGYSWMPSNSEDKWLKKMSQKVQDEQISNKIFDSYCEKTAANDKETEVTLEEANNEVQT